jgi:hypothetical protein
MTHESNPSESQDPSSEDREALDRIDAEFDVPSARLEELRGQDITRRAGKIALPREIAPLPDAEAGSDNGHIPPAAA